MKLTAQIEQVAVNHRGGWLFVSLTDEDGNTGWGEASHSGDDAKCVTNLQAVTETLCTNSEAAGELLKISAHADKVNRTAYSAIEHAWVDLQCRRAGAPVAASLGAQTALPENVPVYANVNRMCQDRSPDTVAKAAQRAVDAGISRLKFAPFDEVSPQALARAGTDIAGLLAPGVARLHALRDGAGPEATLMMDCHWRFNAAALISLARLARDLSIGWIEDPLPVLDYDLAQRLRAESGALIAGGEALLSYDEFVPFVREGAVDVLIADVKYVGGIHALNKICRLAGDHGIAFAPHNPSGPIATAASAHVVAANSNATVLEYPFGEVGWREQFARGEKLRDGQLSVQGPGLGVSLDRQAVG